MRTYSFFLLIAFFHGKINRGVWWVRSVSFSSVSVASSAPLSLRFLSPLFLWFSLSPPSLTPAFLLNDLLSNGCFVFSLDIFQNFFLQRKNFEYYGALASNEELFVFDGFEQGIGERDGVSLVGFITSSLTIAEYVCNVELLLVNASHFAPSFEFASGHCHSLCCYCYCG